MSFSNAEWLGSSINEEQFELICDNCNEILGHHYDIVCPKKQEVDSMTKQDVCTLTKQVALFIDDKYRTPIVATEAMEILPDQTRISEYVTVEFDMLIDIEDEKWLLQQEKASLVKVVEGASKELVEIDRKLLELLKQELG